MNNKHHLLTNGILSYNILLLYILLVNLFIHIPVILAFNNNININNNNNININNIDNNNCINNNISARSVYESLISISIYNPYKEECSYYDNNCYECVNTIIKHNKTCGYCSTTNKCLEHNKEKNYNSNNIIINPEDECD